MSLTRYSASLCTETNQDNEGKNVLVRSRQKQNPVHSSKYLNVSISEGPQEQAK